MELKEKIIKNQEKFLKTAETNEIFSESLLEYLGEDLFAAPASNMESMYNAYPGGLVDHILKVTKYAVILNDNLPETMRLDKKAIIKVCFLHQIGKTFLYRFCESEWHRKNTGKMYDFNEDLTSMRVGERSAYYALTHGVTLSDEEYQAIINYDKPEDDKQSKWYSSNLAEILRLANHLSIMECKNIK